jgi:hypothetical protein
VETPSVLVPLYVHPLADPAAWAELTRSAGRLYGVVINPADGPGIASDPAFAAAAARLREAGVRVLGYVDSAYGERPAAGLTDEVRRHREWYAADGIFFDHAASQVELLPHYKQLADDVKASGVRTVVLNPGIHPDPGYAGIADLLVTFEGDWRTYRRAPVPAWTAEHPQERFCHLVHGVPSGLSDLAAGIATRRGAAVHCAVTGNTPHPWNALPEALGAGAAQGTGH